MKDLSVPKMLKILPARLCFVQCLFLQCISSTSNQCSVIIIDYPPPLSAPRPPALEECPKWAALREVLTEIDGYNKTATAEKADAPGTDAGTAGGSDREGSEGVRSNADQGRVLVAALDDRTCNQLREV